MNLTLDLPMPSLPRNRDPRRPLIMGIVNVTPDSFSDGGRFYAPEAAIEHGKRLADEGADILDIGGESTRPGSLPVPSAEQWRRIGPVVEALARGAVPVSVDTTSADVARHALDAGATIINDVSAGRNDPAMFSVVAAAGTSLILMHMQNEPRTMQENPHYDDCVAEVRAFLQSRAADAEAHGIARERIWVDPGVGFGKNLEHNLAILSNPYEFVSTGYKVIVGASRKSFIGKLFGGDVGDRFPGSLAALVPAFRAGVHAVRVHDVKETHQFLELLARVESL
jgi:dihydropteroate synthase